MRDRSTPPTWKRKNLQEIQEREDFTFLMLDIYASSAEQEALEIARARLMSDEQLQIWLQDQTGIGIVPLAHPKTGDTLSPQQRMEAYFRLRQRMIADLLPDGWPDEDEEYIDPDDDGRIDIPKAWLNEDGTYTPRSEDTDESDSDMPF